MSELGPGKFSGFALTFTSSCPIEPSISWMRRETPLIFSHCQFTAHKLFGTNLQPVVLAEAGQDELGVCSTQD